MPKKIKRQSSVREFSHHDVLSIVKDASVAQIQKVIGLLDEVKEARTRLENLFSSGLGTIEFSTSKAKPTVTKRRGRSAKAVKISKNKNGLSEPRKGTLRALVHAILKEKGPLKAAEIINLLPAKIGKKASVRVQISQVLGNKRDSSIKKVERGIYGYQA